MDSMFKIYPTNDLKSIIYPVFTDFEVSLRKKKFICNLRILLLLNSWLILEGNLMHICKYIQTYTHMKKIILKPYLNQI